MAATAGDTNRQLKALVLLFDKGDILDYAGPTEILTFASYNRDPEKLEHMFALETVARSKSVVTGAGNLTVQATHTFDTLLPNLEDYDLLVVPGGPPDVIHGIVGVDSPEVDFIRAFAALPARPQQLQQRVLLSVCTGAFLLAKADVLGGLDATTHHLALDGLRELRAAVASGKGDGKDVGKVLAGKRWVDGGLIKPGLRIVTAGGVSSGLDATLHVVSLFGGDESAEFVGEVIEFERRQAS